MSRILNPLADPADISGCGQRASRERNHTRLKNQVSARHTASNIGLL